jgi:HSP20 family protein
MIRRTVFTAQGVPQTRRGATGAFPVHIWPQASIPAFPTRWTTPAPARTAVELPVDVFTTSDAAIIRAALPGVDPEQLEVSVYRDTVTIGAQYPAMPAPEGESVTWLVSELGSGTYKRTIRLPFQIEEQQVTAEFANGLLQLTLPKIEAEKPHRVAVQVRPGLTYELGAGDDESFAAD